MMNSVLLIFGVIAFFAGVLFLILKGLRLSDAEISKIIEKVKKETCNTKGEWSATASQKDEIVRLASAYCMGDKSALKTYCDDFGELSFINAELRIIELKKEIAQYA